MSPDDCGLSCPYIPLLDGIIPPPWGTRRVVSLRREPGCSLFSYASGWIYIAANRWFRVKITPYLWGGSDCDDGPQTIDFCDPCAGITPGWSVCVTAVSGYTPVGDCTCIWRGTISRPQMQALFTNCETITPEFDENCAPCDPENPDDDLPLIVASSVKLKCCVDPEAPGICTDWPTEYEVVLPELSVPVAACCGEDCYLWATEPSTEYVGDNSEYLDSPPPNPPPGTVYTLRPNQSILAVGSRTVTGDPLNYLCRQNFLIASALSARRDFVVSLTENRVYEFEIDLLDQLGCFASFTHTHEQRTTTWTLITDPIPPIYFWGQYWGNPRYEKSGEGYVRYLQTDRITEFKLIVKITVVAGNPPTVTVEPRTHIRRETVANYLSEGYSTEYPAPSYTPVVQAYCRCGNTNDLRNTERAKCIPFSSLVNYASLLGAATDCADGECAEVTYVSVIDEVFDGDTIHPACGDVTSLESTS